MKRAYFAISYANRKQFDSEIEALKKLFHNNNVELLVFVDKYNFKSHQESEMMQTAFNEIENSDMLIAELTTKSIGVGIEIGYARARKKYILYLRKQNAKYSTTASGSSNFIMEYTNTENLLDQMLEFLKTETSF